MPWTSPSCSLCSTGQDRQMTRVGGTGTNHSAWRRMVRQCQESCSITVLRWTLTLCASQPENRLDSQVWVGNICNTAQDIDWLNVSAAIFWKPEREVTHQTAFSPKGTCHGLWSDLITDGRLDSPTGKCWTSPVSCRCKTLTSLANLWRIQPANS